MVVQGRLKARSYETREGEKRTVTELEVDEIGPSLTWATAKVTRASRSGGGQGGGGEDPLPARPHAVPRRHVLQVLDLRRPVSPHGDG